MKAIAKCATPDKKTWRTYKAEVMRNGLTFDVARRKAKLAEEKSDLNTEDESWRKRRRVSVSRKILATPDRSSEGSQEENQLNMSQPLTPPLPKHTSNQAHQKKSTSKERPPVKIPSFPNSQVISHQPTNRDMFCEYDEDQATLLQQYVAVDTKGQEVESETCQTVQHSYFTTITQRSPYPKESSQAFRHENPRSDKVCHAKPLYKQTTVSSAKRKPSITEESHGSSNSSKRPKTSSVVEVDRRHSLSPIIHNAPFSLSGSNNLSSTPLSSQRSSVANRQCQSSVTPNQENQSERNTEFERLVLRGLQYIRVTLQQHGEMLSNILRYQELRAPDQPDDNSVKLPKLPVETMRELTDLEKMCADDQVKNKLIACLATVGGSYPVDTTTRVLKKLLSNAVAEQFSWFGAKGKNNFSKLLVKDIVFDAVHRNITTAQATDKEIESTVMSWLRHAKERELVRRKKSQKPAQTVRRQVNPEEDE